MKIFIRTFNDRINSKTGTPLPKDQKRGTPEWLVFERLLIETIKKLGHEVITQAEHPHIPDLKGSFDKRIYVHKTKRDIPQGDFFYMQMHLRNLFTLDTNGWGADHSSNDFSQENFPFDEYAIEWVKELSEKLSASGVSKCDQPETTDATPKKFTLVPIQIPRDYTILWHSPITVRDFIDSIQAWAVETKNYVGFKMHPFNKYDLDLHKAIDDATSRSPYVQKVNGNIHELIKRSIGLFVINSGTGFEALIHGKPVCTFGACDYSKVTFKGSLRRLDEAKNFLLSYESERRDLAYQFVYWYTHYHAYDLTLSNVAERLEEYLYLCTALA